MKRLIRKILKEETEGFLDSSEGDWEWAESSEVTKTIREWYTDLDTLSKLLEPSPIVKISGTFVSDETNAELQYEPFNVNIRISPENTPDIMGVPLKKIYDNEGTMVLSNIPTASVILGDYTEDYDLQMTIKI
jgi:hypothetical protein